MKIQGTLRVECIQSATAEDLASGCPNVKDYVKARGLLITRRLGDSQRVLPETFLDFTVKRVSGKTPIEVGEHLRVTIDDEDES